MSPAATSERRKQQRRFRTGTQTVKITYRDAGGVEHAAQGKLMDSDEAGCGLKTDYALSVGSRVYLLGDFSGRGPDCLVDIWGRVVWCRPQGTRFVIGVEFLEPFDEKAKKAAAAAEASAAQEGGFVDHYEALQLNANADLDTVQRVYRLLAQRYHPDNLESGNAEMFRRVLEAYRTLSEPDKRAAYDIEYHAQKARRWKIFDQPRAATGIEAERRKRSGVLSLLYTKRATSPGQPSMMLSEFEDLLGVPKEHLEFTLWYLKEHSYITRTDNGRWAVTAKGVDIAEEWMFAEHRPTRLIEAGRTERAG